MATLGCSDDSDDDHHHDEGNTGLDDVVYVGRVTDEALEHLLDRTPEDSASHRLVIDSPEADATLSKDEPATISFHDAETSALQPGRIREQRYVAPTWRERAVRDLLGLVGPIKVAHAHGTPFNGVGYFLTISDADGADALRVFTDATSHEPTAEQWSALADAAQPLTLTIVSALFEENDVPADGGPFVGASVDFSVE